ncbi:hypothetical protein Y1Q_0005993 [Alligator mississippiensis]|uniref:Uncharacterized protein n=1 Tax=Alligator mississippiensis TaxID=8496 RepID=A0A151N3L1_ALLMI|nr:hypothetical protein Y1Q_0005993 [Alligator mississippiensis]
MSLDFSREEACTWATLIKASGQIHIGCNRDERKDERNQDEFSRQLKRFGERNTATRSCFQLLSEQLSGRH